MTKEDFTAHACEQVLRFTQVDKWNILSEERKVQLGFNMGVMALGLDLSKEDGFLYLSQVREGKILIHDFRKHIQSLVETHNITVDEANVVKPF